MGGQPWLPHQCSKLRHCDQQEADSTETKISVKESRSCWITYQRGFTSKPWQHRGPHMQYCSLTWAQTRPRRLVHLESHWRQEWAARKQESEPCTNEAWWHGLAQEHTPDTLGSAKDLYSDEMFLVFRHTNKSSFSHDLSHPVFLFSVSLIRVLAIQSMFTR